MKGTDMDDIERMLSDVYHAPDDFLHGYRKTGLWRLPGDREFHDRTGEDVLDQEAAGQRFDAAREEYCRSQSGKVELQLRFESLAEGLMTAILALDMMRAGEDRIGDGHEEIDPAELEEYRAFRKHMEEGFRQWLRMRAPSTFQGGYWWRRADQMIRERFGPPDDRGEPVEFTEDECAYLEQWRREFTS